MQYYAMPVHMLAPEAPPFIPFSNMNARSDLISLDDARRDPAIVYGSFDRLSQTPPVQRLQRKPSTASVSAASMSFSAGTPPPSPNKALLEKLRSATQARLDAQLNVGMNYGPSSPTRGGAQYSPLRDNWF
ncbi:hypothetical protein PsYK624_141410 [Phanerochaete sordida]|uniref:Uncharacterized protein n=1 Tax=Phanerochaete sordida TaxID=48140 RepID=A0A9P3GPE3_9APHY|nr:hypothetical protein PsYK624_141410 [Phanerochaete sordida]